MNNTKNQETKNQQKSNGNAFKALAELKAEASSLLPQIKKCLAKSLNVSRLLKTKAETLRAEEFAKQSEVKALKEEKVEEPKKPAEPTARERILNPNDTLIPSRPSIKKPVANNQQKMARQDAPESGFRTRHFSEQSNNSIQQNQQRRFGREVKPGVQNTRFGNSNVQNGQRPYANNNQRTAQNAGAKPTASKPSVGTGNFDVAKPKIDSKPQQKKKSDFAREDKKSLNRKALVMRGFVADESLENEDGVVMGSRKMKGKKARQQETIIAPAIEHAVITTENLTVKLLAEKIGKPVVEIIKKFMILGNMVNINSQIDFDSAELIASEFGVTLEQKLEKTAEEQLFEIKNITDNEEDLVKRPPVVTVMGHVDHGKTSLLDYIRETNVIAGEAGGITQHIGAYTIEKSGEMITFIDTPGHAAFSAMRERGARLTDIAILVVAADDGVMPQTVEAISEIKSVKAPMIVAINKIDKPEANIDRIKQQLTEHDVIPEEWGGDAIVIPISAKTGQGIDKLLEMILFVAEYQNLRANPKRKAIGSVIEAKLDKGMGPVATMLVQNGTLNVGDVIIAGTSIGKVRAMLNEKGKNVKSALPSYAVSVLGLSSVPSAGDEMYAVDEKMSKKVLSERMVKEKTDKIKATDNSVDALFDRFKETEFKSYNVIIKADVQGSLEALTSTLSELKNEEVKVRCIHGGVGAINENDVMMATASHAIIIGFNVKPDFKAKVLSDKYKVNILFNKIIYEVVDYVTKQIDAMKTPKYKENVSGKAEIRAIFKASKVGAIAGCYILDGKLSRSQQVKVYRKKDVVYTGTIATIQREKDEVKDINAGFECGIVLKDFSQIEIGDIIEGITLERIN